MAAASRLEGPVVAWCKGEFRSGNPGGFAIAVRSAKGGGRYLVLGPNGAVSELASFSGSSDLSCYTPAEARKLDLTIGKSEAVHGKVTPLWNTTVICGFVDATSAACWQYSPAAGAFVKVGEWIT